MSRSTNRPGSSAVDVVLRNCEQAFRYAFSAQQDALWARIRPFAQITNDPTDVEMHDYALSVWMPAEDESFDYGPLAERVHEAASNLAVLPANFALSALLGSPVAPHGAHHAIRLTDDELRPIVRDGEFDAPKQVVSLGDGRHLCEEGAFEETFFRAWALARQALRSFEVPANDFTLIAHPTLEQRFRISQRPDFGAFILGGGPDAVEAWFTPAIPHPDVALLVAHNLRDDQKPCEFVLERGPTVLVRRSGEGEDEDEDEDGRASITFSARMGFRAHRAPWVIRIEPEDYAGNEVMA